MMRGRLIFILMVLTTDISYGQEAYFDKALKIGDNVPSFKIAKLINNGNKSLNIKTYNEQLLIIDFWHTGCSVCIEAMPEMGKLQKEFGNKIKILPVTFEKTERVQTFWNSNKYTRNVRLPSIVEDKIFSVLFPHVSYPHEVWIFKNKVLAITHGFYVNSENISKVLSGKKIFLPLKYDYYTFNREKPIFALDSNQIDPINSKIQYTAICDFRNGINSGGGSGGSGIFRDSINHTVRTYFLNQPIYNSYLSYWMEIYGLRGLITPYINVLANQVIWKVRDKTRYQYIKGKINFWDWILNNSICFESVYPDTGQTNKQIYQTAIKDLDNLLGLKVRWQKKSEKIFVIKKLKKYHKITENALIEGIPLYKLVYDFNNIEGNPYMFNECGLSNVIIPLKKNKCFDHENIKESLEFVGLELLEEERAVDHLYFEEVNGGNLIDPDIQNAEKLKILSTSNARFPSAEEGEEFLRSNKNEIDVKITSSGLQYKILHKGNGKKPLLSDKVLLNYEGRLINGKIFSSSFTSGKPQRFFVSGTIKGISEALQLMEEGSKIEIYVPSNLAEGWSNTFISIPPKSVLVFTLELIQILK